MYAESMELFSRIISLATELAKLARTLVADGIRYIVLLARSRTALIADSKQSGIGSGIPESWVR